jgi:hypothetical protein
LDSVQPEILLLVGLIETLGPGQEDGEGVELFELEALLEDDSLDPVGLQEGDEGRQPLARLKKISSSQASSPRTMPSVSSFRLSRTSWSAA